MNIECCCRRVPIRPVTLSLLDNFSPPLEKYVGHCLKNWATLRKLFAPLVSQAGYRSGSNCFLASFKVKLNASLYAPPPGAPFYRTLVVLAKTCTL